MDSFFVLEPNYTAEVTYCEIPIFSCHFSPFVLNVVFSVFEEEIQKSWCTHIYEESDAIDTWSLLRAYISPFWSLIPIQRKTQLIWGGDHLESCTSRGQERQRRGWLSENTVPASNSWKLVKLWLHLLSQFILSSLAETHAHILVWLQQGEEDGKEGRLCRIADTS